MGEKYTGSLPSLKITDAQARTKILRNMNDWATKIANDNTYHYKIWRSSDPKTKECPVCKKYPIDAPTTDTAKSILGHHGWNCIGFAFAVWHHGGQLGTACNCHVIANDTAQKIIAAKTDAEALKIAKKFIKADDLVVIRGKNGKDIPKSEWKAGDVMCQFKGNTYTHTYYYRGGGMITDSTGSGGKTAVNKQIATRSYNNYTARIIFRYTGRGPYGEKTALELRDPRKNQVEHWQKYVNWFFGKTVIKADGIFGSETEKYTKKIQKKLGVEQDGKVGSKTIAAAKKYEKTTMSVKSNYSGILPSTKLIKTNAEVIADTIKWAKWIARDNRFHYGAGKDAHHNGCYFCGTQPKSKKNAGIVDYKFTYCCNPFVGAAWTHGGCVPKALELCQKGSSWDFNKGSGYDKSSLFDNLGKPEKSKLKKGDVLCSNGHVALYIGNGKIVEAASEDNNKKGTTSWDKSIRVTELTNSRYKGFKRVHRFNGKVSTISSIRYGEVGTRVAQWQMFLDWYFDGQVGSADGIFGDNTLKWTKKFQEKEVGKGQDDGLVGPKTLEAAAKVKK